MKATLYRLPAKHVLVLEAKDGTINVEYPPSEVRAHQIAQDAGAPTITFSRIEDLLKTQQKKQK
jgi:hypothetical protein